MKTFYSGTGFSIELKNYHMEYRGKHEGLPLFEASGGEITAIAIVEDPAIGKGTFVNEIYKTIHGPVMIADLKIFRDIGLNGEEYCYWYFSKETIKVLQESFKGKIKPGH